MSRLEDLIKKLCPNGVEFKTLGEVTRKNKFHQVGAAELEALVKQDCQNEVRLLPSSKNDDWWSDETACRGLVCEGEVITLGRARYANLKYHKGKFVSSNNYIIQSGDGILCRYLYHFIKRNYASFYVDSATYPKFENSIFRSFQIPVPPLEVQKGIARILDKFATLEAELEAELEARRKQYIFYQKKLFEFNENVEFKPLAEVCSALPKGTLKTAQLTESGYPVVNSGRDFYGYYPHFNNDGNAFTFASRGEYAGFVTYLKEKFWAGGLCYPYRSKNEDVYLTKFIYYYLKSKEADNITCLVERGSIPALNKADVSAIPIPIPPLAEQKRIVEILDKFSTLIDDISSGLPAEIKMRHHQYEHYRDKLLTFTPAA